ncbi:MAG: GYD domain-containing protein [Candidatus Bathyarchaeia archaeon]
MAHFIILGNWTDQGVRNLKDVSKHVEASKQMLEQAGGKQHVYFTMGEYDFVVIAEAPNDEPMVKFVLSVGKLGNVRTKTLEAWTDADAAKMLAQLQ